MQEGNRVIKLTQLTLWVPQPSLKLELNLKQKIDLEFFFLNQLKDLQLLSGQSGKH